MATELTVRIEKILHHLESETISKEEFVDSVIDHVLLYPEGDLGEMLVLIPDGRIEEIEDVVKREIAKGPASVRLQFYSLDGIPENVRTKKLEESFRILDRFAETIEKHKDKKIREKQ